MSGIVGSNLGRGSGLVKATPVADESVDSDAYVDGSVDLVHLQTGTDGQIITWNASGNPAAVGPGSDGQVLTSTGAGSPPAFEDAGGGAWNYIDSGTASGSSSIDFDSARITSTYDQYAVTMTNIKPATDSVILWLRFSVSGSFITATDYPEAFMGINNNASGAANNAGWANSASAKISMNSNASSNKLGTATNEQYNGTVFIYNPSDASHFTTCRGHCVYETDGGIFTTGSMGGHYIQTSAVDGIRFMMSSGDIASGVFRVYGLVNS